MRQRRADLRVGRSFLLRLTGATAQQEGASSSVRRRTMTVALAS